jgi:hypothetical protein
MIQRITPPPELVQQWEVDATTGREAESSWTAAFAARAAQWGADMELEACQQWLVEIDLPGFACQLRAARRPKTPSLKEQAYAALDTYIYGNPDHGDKQNTYNIIRRALELIDD